MKTRDLIIVGGGPAGMAAALAAYECGVRDILLIERDECLGGILNQCIHTGFGISYFGEVLTGPEYAEQFAEAVNNITDIEVTLRSFVVDLKSDKILTYLKPGKLEKVKAKALIMATGCRERTREMIHIPGSRPAGIFPAGLAQKLINIDGVLPGNQVVIVGSGDIGLIMARRFTFEGAEVKAVIEIMDKTRGLLRNVVQCVDDFEVPIYFRHKITRIIGRDRVEGIEMAELDDDLNVIETSRKTLECDTLLVSVGLIPENELVEMAGVELDKGSNGPLSDEINVTSIPGIFVCGNAFNVYDIVDNVTKDSQIAGRQAAQYLKGLK